MKTRQTYLKGKSVFIVSLFVILITVLIVFITGINFNRSITTNFYLSLSIIGGALFLFMAYGLYKGIGLTDNFPKFKTFESGNVISQSGQMPDLPNLDAGYGIGGLIVSILLWIGMTILLFVLLIVLEAFFWVSIFIILTMLYWVFFRALKIVFSKSQETKGEIGVSALFSFGYSALYLGWIFGLVYLLDFLK